LEGDNRVKEVFKDPPASLPYQKRIGHRLATVEKTKKPSQDEIWMDNACQGGPVEEK